MKRWHGLFLVALGVLIAIVVEPLVAKFVNPILSPAKLSV
jgi:hypothetical protein